MTWPTDDLLTDKLDELSDNPVESLPQIYAAVVKLQAVLAELTDGDTVLSAENAASNGIAVTGANNNFSTTQTVNTQSVAGVIVNTTDPDWNPPYSFYRGGTVNDGFRIIHTAPAASGGYMAFQVGNGSGVNDRLRLYQGTQVLEVQATDVLFNNVSLLNNAKSKGAWDEDTFNPLTDSFKTGASIAWTPTGDYNRLMIVVTAQTQNNSDGGSHSEEYRLRRNGTSVRTQRFWTAEDQEGNGSFTFFTSSTSAATWDVQVRKVDTGPATDNVAVITTLAIWEVNA